MESNFPRSACLWERVTGLLTLFLSKSNTVIELARCMPRMILDFKFHEVIPRKYIDLILLGLVKSIIYLIFITVLEIYRIMIDKIFHTATIKISQVKKPKNSYTNHRTIQRIKKDVID